MHNRKTHQAQPQWLVLFVALLLVALIGWLDYTTRWEWSFFICYALPIGLVAWKTDRRHGFALAVLCAVIWCLAQIETHPYETNAGFALATAGRLFYFAVLVVAVATVKDQKTLARSRIEELERMQALEMDVLWAREREEQRLGSFLHDSLGSDLAAIAYASNFLWNDLRERHQPEAESAKELLDMVHNAVTTVQNMSRGIFPVETDESGLVLALAELALSSSERTRMSVSFYESGDALVNDMQVAMHLYRIAQEAVRNAAKHGGASKVTILLDKRAESLRLVIADDGKGMAAPHDGMRGIGLRTMRYRARALGGDLTIDSKPNDGTIVSCNVPNKSAVPVTPSA